MRAPTTLPIAATLLASGLLLLASPALGETQRRVSGGFNHTCALDAGGGAKCWGENTSGQLGDGTTTNRTTPVSVVGLSSGVAALATGERHSCALSSVGGVKCWGLGHGATPVDIAGLTGVVAIAAYWDNTCAVTNAGRVKCWGAGTSGALGNGTSTGSSTPVDVSGITSGATAVSVGGWNACAIVSGGLRCWGHNSDGQLGIGTTVNRNTPAVVPMASLGGTGVTVTAISMGERHACAVNSAGTAFCWGRNADAQVGDGTTTARTTPVQIATGAADISTGARHGCLRTTAGAMRCWGYNGYGQVGNGTSANIVVTPTTATGLATGTGRIGLGVDHSCAFHTDGSLKCWGYGTPGTIGDGGTAHRTTPTNVAPLSTTVTPVPMRAVPLAIGSGHTCAVVGAGAKCWGQNGDGQLGDGTRISRSTPADVAGLTSGVVAVATGDRHSCALLSSGAVRCWGEGAGGQLGDGTLADRLSPVAALGLASGVAAIATGAMHTCALMTDQSLRCWGTNNKGQLGIGGTANQAAPVTAGIFTSGFLAITAGREHTCALRSGGEAWCWGANEFAQLGSTAPTTLYDVPRGVSSSDRFSRISAGGNHTCAITLAGGARCWGRGALGQLGASTTPAFSGPVAVTGLGSGVTAIATGEAHSCALVASGAVLCWGENAGVGEPMSEGALGDGTSTSRSSPTSVAGFASGMTAVAAGVGSSGAVATDGSVRMWGENGSGKLGDGSFTLRRIPQLVVGQGGVGFLDLSPSNGLQIPVDKVPVFPIAVSGGIGPTTSSVTAVLPQGVAAGQKAYVYAYAPASIVKRSSAKIDGEQNSIPARVRDGSKVSVACVLAQVVNGELHDRSPSELQEYLANALSAQNATVKVIDGILTANIAGATFYLGLGTSPTEMYGSGRSRSVTDVPGTLECRPQAPQSGWWLNPAEPGRGYTIEFNGRKLWTAAYLYDASGRASWYVAGGDTQLDGAIHSSDLYLASGGQTLAGAWKPYTAASVGKITYLFTDATHGTITFPNGRSIPIQRHEIAPGSLSAASLPARPEDGWYWNAAEGGRAFFIEWQGDQALVSGYMYDAAGNPVWYISIAKVTNAMRFESRWWEYGGGQTLTGAFKPHTQVNDNVAPALIEFTSATQATLTLPGGRTTRLTRYRF